MSIQENTPRFEKIGFWVSLILPAILAGIVYLQNRPLFLDSLNLARNLGERPLSNLHTVLYYEQSAPLFFLYLSKIVTSITGISQYSLRLIPFLAAFLALGFLFHAGKKILRSPFIYIAILWLGTHELFIRYATEYKQYMTDLMATAIILWMGLTYKRIDSKNWWKIVVISGFLIWLSMPSVFVLAGMMSVLFINEYKTDKKFLPFIGSSALIAGCFLVNYYSILLPTINSKHMQNFHDSYFLIGKFWDMDAFIHDMDLKISIARMVVGKTTVAITALIILIFTSLINAIKHRNEKILLLILPIALAFFASLLGKYSILERLMLFSLPLYILLAVDGLQVISGLSNNKLRIGLITVLGFGLLVGFTQKQAFKYVISPLDLENNRAPLTYIANHPDKMRRILCTQHAYPGFDYYVNHEKLYPQSEIGNGIKTYYNTDIIGLARIQLDKQGAIWLMAAHMNDVEIDKLIEKIKPYARIIDTYRSNQSGAFLLARKEK